MIVVDTSALMSIVLGEPAAEACKAALDADPARVMSAGTLAEALVVSGRRSRSERLSVLLDLMDAEIVPVTTDTARRVGEAYARWGKGSHPARLNFADCFAYALAQERGAPLLYVGSDFAQTDVASALPGAADA